MVTVGDRATVEKIDLEKFRLAVMMDISNELLFAEPPDVKLETMVSWTTDMLRVGLMQAVWGKDVESKRASWPDGWWQAFKERWFPPWAKRRWPVKYKWIEMTGRALFPKLAMPKGQHECRIVVMDRNWYDSIPYYEREPVAVWPALLERIEQGITTAWDADALREGLRYVPLSHADRIEASTAEPGAVERIRARLDVARLLDDHGQRAS